MVTILPALLERTSEGLAHGIERLSDVTPFLHVDIVGSLVNGEPTHSSPEQVAQVLNDPLLGVQYSMHLMNTADELERWLPSLATVSTVVSIIIHIEVGETLETHLRAIRASGKAVGVALNPDTSIESIRPYIHLLDQVMIMSVQPGEQGRAFEMNAIERVRTLRAEYPQLDITVDGAVTLENNIAQTLVQAGANVLVVGSRIAKAPEPKHAYEEFVRAVHA